MEYISAKEASEKWEITLRQVQRLLADNRISGAKKYGRSWMIPNDAEKPIDLRRERKLPQKSFSSDFAQLLAATTIPMPRDNPDSILDTVGEKRLSLQYEAELAYLRGDFAETMRCFHATWGDDAARLRACPAAIAAGISLGDYRAYTEIREYLVQYKDDGNDSHAAAVAELALATAAVSLIAPKMAPDWLRIGDFSLLPTQAKPDALYLRAKYFHCVGNLEAMLAVAQTALDLSASEQGITFPDIYLRVTCAVACYSLERKDEAKRWLLGAMYLALPHGFTTPFAEVVTSLGGLMEECLEQAYPEYYDAVIRQWKRTWKNWIAFHNQFTEDNITLMLTLREYHIAAMVAHHVPYAQIAKKYKISVGRLKNIMMGVYGKLLISGRAELRKYII